MSGVLDSEYLGKFHKVAPAAVMTRNPLAGGPQLSNPEEMLKPVEGNVSEARFLVNAPERSWGMGTLVWDAPLLPGQEQYAYVLQMSNVLSGSPGKPHPYGGLYLSRVSLKTGALSNAAGGAGFDCVDGKGSAARLGINVDSPGGMVMSTDGKYIYHLVSWCSKRLYNRNRKVWYYDMKHYTVQLRRYDITEHPASVVTLKTWPASAAKRFNQMVIDKEGKTLYGVFKWTGVMKIELDAAKGYPFTTIAGAFKKSGHVDGVGTKARFHWPTSLAFTDDYKGILIADGFHSVSGRHKLSNNAIRYLDVSTTKVTTLVGGGPATMGWKDGIDTEAELNKPTFILRIPNTEPNTKYIFFEQGSSLLRMLQRVDSSSNQW